MEHWVANYPPTTSGACGIITIFQYHTANNAVVTATAGGVDLSQYILFFGKMPERLTSGQSHVAVSPSTVCGGPPLRCGRFAMTAKRRRGRVSQRDRRRGAPASAVRADAPPLRALLGVDLLAARGPTARAAVKGARQGAAGGGRSPLTASTTAAQPRSNRWMPATSSAPLTPPVSRLRAPSRSTAAAGRPTSRRPA